MRADGLPERRRASWDSTRPAKTPFSVGDGALCASCEAEVRWRPWYAAEVAYCCPGCGAGGPCVCSYDEAVE